MIIKIKAIREHFPGMPYDREAWDLVYWPKGLFGDMARFGYLAKGAEDGR